MSETVLRLKLEGRKNREIAEATGLTLQAVKNIWFAMQRSDRRAGGVPKYKRGPKAISADAGPVPGLSPQPTPPRWDFSGEDLELPGGRFAR